MPQGTFEKSPQYHRAYRQQRGLRKLQRWTHEVEV